MAEKKHTYMTWNPGLDNDHLTLRMVYDTLPGNPPEDMPWYIFMLENPKSPLALPGAINLFNHDCVHILLGRGLWNQDEAFVIGFTMGSVPACKPWQAAAFRFMAKHLYKKFYRMNDTQLAVHDFAFQQAKLSGCVPLNTVDFKSMMDLPLGEIRHRLGLRTRDLYALFRQERMRWPDTKASLRLPRHPDEPDLFPATQMPEHRAENAGGRA